MNEDPARYDAVKRKLRKLKRLEAEIRFDGGKPDRELVWDSYFGLHDRGITKARYTLDALAGMSRDAYRRVIDEYFARVYYELYKEKGITAVQKVYDPDILSRLGLHCAADENDIKKRFRELAKEYHPDTGGSAERFIELMNDYQKLIGKQR